MIKEIFLCSSHFHIGSTIKGIILNNYDLVFFHSTAKYLTRIRSCCPYKKSCTKYQPIRQWHWTRFLERPSQTPASGLHHLLWIWNTFLHERPVIVYLSVPEKNIHHTASKGLIIKTYCYQEPTWLYFHGHLLQTGPYLVYLISTEVTNIFYPVFLCITYITTELFISHFTITQIVI